MKQWVWIRSYIFWNICTILTFYFTFHSLTFQPFLPISYAKLINFDGCDTKIDFISTSPTLPARSRILLVVFRSIENSFEIEYNHKVLKRSLVYIRVWSDKYIWFISMISFVEIHNQTLREKWFLPTIYFTTSPNEKIIVGEQSLFLHYIRRCWERQLFLMPFYIVSG